MSNININQSPPPHAPEPNSDQSAKENPNFLQAAQVQLFMSLAAIAEQIRSQGHRPS